MNKIIQLLRTHYLYFLKASAFLILLFYSLKIVFSEQNIKVTSRSASYDERMWTSVSIASYAMFTGYQREPIRHDSWFLNYAYKYRLDGFGLTQNNTIQVDFEKIPKKTYQWFDFTLWTFGWKAPNFSKISKGWYIHLRNNNVDPDGYWELGDPNKNEDPRIYHSRAPDKVIEHARQVDALFCFLSLGFVFCIGWRFFDFFVGLFAHLYLLSNKNFISVTTAVGMDSSLFLFSLSAIFFTLLLIEKLQKSRTSLLFVLITSLGIGLSLGLAISSKYNGATLFYSVTAVGASLLIALLYQYPIYKKNKNKRAKRQIRERQSIKSKQKEFINYWGKHAIIASLIIACSSLSTFLYLNPHMQKDTTTKVKIIRNSVDEFFETRAKSLRTTHIKDSWSESFRVVSKRLYFSFPSDNKPVGFIGTLGQKLQSRYYFLDGVCLIMGIFILTFTTREKIKRKNIDAGYVLMVFSVIIFYMNVDFIWTPFARYFTPFLICGSLIISIGICGFLKIALRKISPILQKKKR